MTDYYTFTPDQLRNFKEDSRKAEKQRQAFISRKLNASIHWSLSSIFRRSTLCNSTTSALLAFSLFGIITHVYA